MQASGTIYFLDLKIKFFSGHGEANGVGGIVSSKLKRKRSESQMEIDNPIISRPNKR